MKPAPLASAWRSLGHGAVWTGLYVSACCACAVQTATPGAHPGVWRVLLAAFLTAQSVYLLDRVKLCDALLDPADRLAHPERFAFVFGYRRPLRVFLVIEAILAGLLLFSMSAVLSLLVPLALVGVIAYAGLPRSAPIPPGARRIKDYLILKNLAVSVGICAFSLLLAMGAGGTPAPTLTVWLWPGVFLFLHVLTDSMLCDIDDRDADARFGTHTLAWRATPRAVRALSLTIAVLIAIATTLLYRPGAFTRISPDLAGTRIAWSVVMAITSAVLVRVRAGHMRDTVDLRLPIVAGVLLVFR